MPPKRAPTAVPTTNSKAAQARVQNSSSTNNNSSAPARALRDTYDALTAKENRSVVQAVAGFGVSLDLSFVPRPFFTVS